MLTCSWRLQRLGWHAFRDPREDAALWTSSLSTPFDCEFELGTVCTERAKDSPSFALFSFRPEPSAHWSRREEASGKRKGSEIEMLLYCLSLDYKQGFPGKSQARAEKWRRAVLTCHRSTLQHVTQGQVWHPIWMPDPDVFTPTDDQTFPAASSWRCYIPSDGQQIANDLKVVLVPTLLSLRTETNRKRGYVISSNKICRS